MVTKLPVSLHKRSQLGFTLIEVMIVVVIVAILAAIAYPSYTRFVQDSRQVEAQGQLMDYASQLEAFRAKNFQYPANDAAARVLAPDLYASDFYNTVYVRPNAQTYTITSTPRGMMVGTDTLSYTSAGAASWD